MNNPNMDQQIRIVEIIIDQVTEPRMDGSPGCALYAVPFQLSRRPSEIWCKIFINEWNHPRQFSSMHRPGIARIVSDKIILDGTTIDEVKQYHRDTLVLCVNETNRKETEYLRLLEHEKEAQRMKSEAHRQQIDESARGIEF